MAVPTIGRRWLAAAVGTLVAGTMGCGSTHSTSGMPSTSNTGLIGAPASVSGPPTTGSPAAAPNAAAADAAKSFCPVANPAALTRAETAGAISHAAGHTTVPVAVAPDASSFFAMDGSDVRSLKNLVWIRDHGRKQQTVFTLAAPYAGYGAVAFDGRWLIFMADRTQELTGAWDLYAWDSQGTAAPRQIATDPGTAPNSPVEWPRVQGGKATWVQALADGTQQVHLYDLAKSKDAVVHTGHLGASLFAGDLLVWTEAAKPDTPAAPTAISIATGAPAQLPGPVAQAQTGPATIATDGTTWAWTGADYRTLYAWRPGTPAPVTIHTADQGDAMDSLGVSGDVVTWTSSTATFAANLKTGSYTQVTKQYGSALTNWSAIAIYYPVGDLKAPDLSYEGYVLKAADFSALPGC